ncbi:unnamed protein product [Arabis nemorensis]|uniref:RNA polymerase subunit H/Rpb5 C-terminal domain-containing protein n=1 Tax=Arabis nemorensis TaxID=586526 RepID=A0A565CTI1_9BRAS|nr:unnamed protein product [Arabis nemorensis]
MTLSEEEISKLFRVCKTLNQMLKDRGYDVADSDIEMTKEQFVDKYGENMIRKDLSTLKVKRNDESDKIFVFFPKEKKVGTEDIKRYLKRMESANVFRAIVVIQENLTRFALSSIKVAASKFHIEVFQETELLLNVRDHVFVPEHIALTTEETKTLLERYTVKENQLPRIQFTDPIARYFGLKHGQVVKIIRSSETSGRYVTYRYVI